MYTSEYQEHMCEVYSKEIPIMHLKTVKGPSLLLEKSVWNIAEKDVSAAVLGGLVLESISWKNRRILEAACKENNCKTDVS